MKAKTNFAMMIGMSLAIASMTGVAYAENSIGIFSLQSEIEASESIRVTGFVDSVSFYKPVKIEVIDPNGVSILSPNVQFNDDGKFSWLFHPPLGKFDATGTYTIVASHEDLEETAQIQFTVTEKPIVENPWLKEIVAKEDESDVIRVQQETPNTNRVVSAAENTLNTSQERIVQPVKINSENSIVAQSQQIMNSESAEDQNSSTIITAAALSIAGIVAGVVIWMKMTYAKPMIQK